MKKTIVSLAAVIFTQPALAQNWELTAGISENSVKIKDSSSTSEVTGSTGVFFGANTKIPIQDQVSFRTGASYLTKSYKVTNSSLDGKFQVNLNYLVIPLTVNYSMDNLNAFAGFDLATKITSGYSNSGDFEDSKVDQRNLLTSYVVGGNFMFQPNMGFEVNYSFSMEEPVDGLNSASSLSLGFIYTL